MLSRKQKWKMVTHKSKIKIYANCQLDNNPTLSEKVEKDIDDNDDNIFRFLLPQKKITKSVSFSKYANVALIPQSCEYFEAELSDKLWYSHDDLDLFKKIRIEEILKERQELKESQDPKYATL